MFNLLKNTVVERWRRISSSAIHRNVFKAAMTVGGFTLAAKFVAMFKESVVAAYFGTGDSLDAFVIALLVPSTIITLIPVSLNYALLPTYIEVREREGKLAAQRLFETVLTWNTGLLILIAVAVGGTMNLWLPVVASGFSPDKLVLTRSLLYLMLPIVLITGYTTTWGAVLNAGNRFAVVAAAPVMTPASIILAIVLFGHRFGIFALSFGMLTGAVIEAAIVGWMLARKGHPILPRWHGTTDAVRKVRGQYGACFAAAFLMSGTGLVDQSMASMLGPSSNAALSYGIKVMALFRTLGMTSIGTAILPQLSMFVASNNWIGFQKMLRNYVRLVLIAIIPLTLLLLGCSRWIVETLYQRGAFLAGDTNLVNHIQMMYFLMLPSAVVGVLVTRSITAISANQLFTRMAVVTVVLNAVLNYLFMQKMGVAGIALSSTCCDCVAILFLSMMLRNMLSKKMGIPNCASKN